MGRDSRLRQFGLVTPGGAPIRRATPKVALAYCFGTLHYPFVRSLQMMREHDFKRMGQGQPPVVWYSIPQSGLYIDHNRNIVVEKFLKTDAEWLLQIDTDIEFPPDIAETMLELAGDDKKILAASVPLPDFKTPDGTPCDATSAWMMTEHPGVWHSPPASLITAEGIKCDGLATAVILIHRSVFEGIADQVGQCWFLKTMQPRLAEESSRKAWLGDGPTRDRQYISVGEDLSFCIRAADAGFQPWCAMVPGLRHYKTQALSHDFDQPQEAPPARAMEAAQ